MAEQSERDERTEEATPRRRQEAREKGQVAFSSELTAATMLLATGATFLALGGHLVGAAGGLVASSVSALHVGNGRAQRCATARVSYRRRVRER